MRRLAAVPLLLALLLGCATDDSQDTEDAEDTAPPRALASLPPLGSPSPTSPSPAAGVDAPTAAYLAWLDALATRDAATACTIQHPELTIALRQEAILLDRAELGDPCTGFEPLLWEDPLRELEPVSVETTTLTEEKATLAVVFPDSEATVRLELQRAAWRVLSEERRTAGTGATARWLASWCDLSVGSTREQVLALMGPPSGEYTVADGGEPQLWWAADQYDFRAYLDPVGDTVTDLVGDYDALTAGERSGLTCPELR